MRTFVLLRDPNVDGNGTGGTPPVNPPTPATPPESAKDVWGGRTAPEWIKASGLGTVHDKSNIGGPINDEPKTAQPVNSPKAPAQATPPPAQQPAAPSTVTPPPAQVPAAPAGVDPKAFATALKEALAPFAREQQPGQTPPPAPTEAEMAAQLGVFTATEADYEELLGVKPSDPRQVAALNRMLQSVAKQAVTIAQVLNQRALTDHQKSIAPYIQSIRAAEAERQKATFYRESPDLVGYEVIANDEFQAMLARGEKLPSVEAARKAVADRTRAKLKAIGITPVARPGSPTQSTTIPKPSTRQMTTASTGGHGGGSATTVKPANNLEAVWGKR